jgi:Domain of unknown function (DUF4865)
MGQGLALKAFVGREHGRSGAIANAYGASYLWLAVPPLVDFLMGAWFQRVIDSFGRPRVETWLPMDARKGRAAEARFVARCDVDLLETVDRTEFQAAEIVHNKEIAARANTVAVFTALDPTAWRLSRFTLSSDLPDGSDPGICYQVFHLSQPYLRKLA